QLPKSGAADVAGMADFYGGGRPDILVVVSNSIIVLKNNWPLTNSPPPVPQNLQAIVSAEGVGLSWGAAKDREQQAGLSYNVRLGRTSGKDDVMPSMTSASGQLLMPKLGNASLNTHWQLYLPPGKYFWSVQAIDNSYAASSFAPEQSFEVVES